MADNACPEGAIVASADREPPHRAEPVATTDGGDRTRRVRVDAGAALAPGGTSMLRVFGLGFARAGRPAPKPVPEPERRGEERHQAVECLAWVGWKCWRGFVMNDAVLVNLSRGGARVFVDRAPPRGRPIWVYLETPGRKAVVRAEVREFETTAQGQCTLRVEFSEPCPYALFEAAVCGMAAADPSRRARRPVRPLAAPLSAAPASPRRPRRAVVFG